MAYSEEEIDQMKKKLDELKSLLSFQIEMGEDTNIVSQKIQELEQTLKNN